MTGTVTAFASFESASAFSFFFLFGWGKRLLLFSTARCIFICLIAFFSRLGVGLQIDYEADMEESDSRICVMSLYFFLCGSHGGANISFFFVLYTYCVRMDNSYKLQRASCSKKTPSCALK